MNSAYRWPKPSLCVPQADNLLAIRSAKIELLSLLGNLHLANSLYLTIAPRGPITGVHFKCHFAKQSKKKNADKMQVIAIPLVRMRFSRRLAIDLNQYRFAAALILSKLIRPLDEWLLEPIWLLML